jgi:hypothetical protein
MEAASAALRANNAGVAPLWRESHCKKRSHHAKSLTPCSNYIRFSRKQAIAFGKVQLLEGVLSTSKLNLYLRERRGTA